MERVKVLETDYIRALLARAPVVFPDWRLLRRPAGGTIRIASGDFIRTGIGGQCDVQAIGRGGRIVEIEAKNVNGNLRPDQVRWRDWCREWCVPWVMLRVMKTEQPGVTVERWINELRPFFVM